MKKMLYAMVVAASAACAAPAGAVVTNVYTGFTFSGGGAPYSGFAGSIITPDVQFFTDNAGNWHPFGLSEFGSDSFGSLSVAIAGNYTFSLFSDDGSLAFIDGGLVVNDGGAHAPTGAIGSVFLTAGVHSFEVQFFECCGGPSGVDFNVPTGVSLVPEPGTWAMMLLGFAGLGAMYRTRHKSAIA
jgi:hypothetical protein